MRVLIIDDDPGTCETVATGLWTLGRHDVRTAQTGRQGLALAAAESFDVVIVDQRLPDMDGVDLLPALRATASANATAYMFTAYGRLEDAVLAMKRGAADYLRKETCDIIELSRLLAEPVIELTIEDSRVREVTSLILQRPAMQPMDLAGAVNLSESRLRHLFVGATGIPLGVFQRHVRLDRAALLLRVSALMIKQIAASVGWCDESSFAESFHKRFGCSPAEYRTKHHSADYSDSVPESRRFAAKCS